MTGAPKDKGHLANGGPPKRPKSKSDPARNQRDRRQFEALRAEFERQGYGLHEMSDKTYFVVEWRLYRHLPDLSAVWGLLLRIGGRK